MVQTVPKPMQTYGNFDLVTQTKLDYTNLEVQKWRSRVTGLSVVHLDYEGAPVVYMSCRTSRVLWQDEAKY